MSVKLGQDKTEVVQVLLEATNIHEDAIKVYYYILTRYIKEDLVHQPLKG